ncbi:unnamed protein product [Arctia plantaginis]|uniref:Nose resistant-to-fluoxetine protein N-terminal domain-containing protein n=1 Tax=Arctia plantaginis TaxID=874455 RepID=A0A8S0Z0Q6_ARCPL|nr:unnamed protein product [Arctia plantaginis]
MFKFLFLCFTCIVTLSTSNVKSHENGNFPAIDNIIQGLNEEVWSDEEAMCLQKTLELLQNVKNFTLWATWIWDANKLPSGNLYGSWIQLSNYDQCLNPPWLDTHPQFKTQYCTAEVEMTRRELKRGVFDPYASTEVYMKTKTRHGYRVNQFTWGVCVLASCEPSSVAKILKHMYLGTHFRAISNPNITIYDCDVAGESEDFGVGYYVFMCLIVSLSIVAVGCTYYRTRMKSQTIPNDSTVGKILESFCMNRNTTELTKTHKDEIIAVNGIRSLTSACMVWLHVLYLYFISGCANSGDFDERIFLFDKFVNMNLLVDTFFAMSGMLQIKGLLGRKQINVLLILWKRYVRLIGLFALSMFYYASVVKFHGSGPLWNIFYNSESSICQRNWWFSLLMLNYNSGTYCYSVTWYIACDYQYTVLATLLIYIYKKNRRLALNIFGLAALISVVIPGVLTYWHKLPPMYYLDVGDFLTMRGDDRLNYTYFSSYSRAGPYIVGMCLGYIMHVYNPAIHRHCLSVLNSVTGAIFSLLLMTFSACLGSFFLERDYNVLEASLAAATYRSIWAVGVCGIIAFCEYGKLPLLTDFFSSSFFTPLSRLSYGVYLLHCLVLQQTNKIVTIKSAPIYDSFAVIIDTAGVGAVCVGMSYVLWLILEAPLNNLSDRFVCNRFTSKQVEPSKKNAVDGEQIKIKNS